MRSVQHKRKWNEQSVLLYGKKHILQFETCFLCSNPYLHRVCGEKLSKSGSSIARVNELDLEKTHNGAPYTKHILTCGTALR